MPITESALTSGFVVGVLIRSLADSSDAGDLPDILPANVKPIFTRAQGQYRLALAATDSAGAHGALVQHEQVKTAIIQTGEHVGHITDDVDANGAALPDAVPGVRLVVGTYKVSFGGHFPDLNNVEVTSAHTQAAPLDLADLVGYTPLPGITVKTVALPSGGVSGQMLVLSGDELVWAEPAAGEPGPAGASVTGGVDNGDGTVSFTLSDGSTTDPVVLPPGPAGKSAYQLAVDGGYVGTLEEWLESLQGVDGADSTVPGPANSLTIGTVTTGPAAATITGASPNQTLNLTLPQGPAPSLAIGTVTKLAAGATPTASFTGTNPYTLNLGLVDGADGSPTPYDKRGTGMPNGVVTGNPGDTYTDTAGTNGAWVWRKASGTGNTGWVVIDGDTGWRNFNGLLTSAPTSGKVMARRAGNLVMYRFVGLQVADSFIVEPSGFVYPTLGRGGQAGIIAELHDSNNAPISGRVFVNRFVGNRIQITGLTSALGDGGLTFFTDDSWPTTLPGTAA